MPNPYFSFKQFTIHHDRCAMKVGTDGVLLGAWADVSAARHILDIGTGTGLIALMMAQRNPDARIVGIDIDREAVEQARENIADSPWKDRVEVVLQDVCTYHPSASFDVIVSNPPYFVNALKCPDGQRNAARHTDCLDFEGLTASVSRLLSPQGTFSVIIPTDGMEDFLRSASHHGLHLSRRTWVHTKPDASPKRVLLAFNRPAEKNCTENHLVIELSRHVYSAEYTALTRDFYLKM
ncbi:MAG: tRNA1(Val) (adenine(37)-N6)-methyltransferase [Bacteroidales bacterium]|nr:tRNA1(Val) (adenine(37)-N6)-methyltransferase [Bacteroidales bacterium]